MTIMDFLLILLEFLGVALGILFIVLFIVTVCTILSEFWHKVVLKIFDKDGEGDL